MSVHKNEDNGTWYVMARYTNWKGEHKQKCKRGFPTKREAQEWERTFQLQNAADMDMSFEAFTELYEKDIRPRLKENTWLTKEHIIKTKMFGIIVIFLQNILLGLRSRRIKMAVKIMVSFGIWLRKERIEKTLNSRAQLI